MKYQLVATPKLLRVNYLKFKNQLKYFDQNDPDFVKWPWNSSIGFVY